MQHPFVGGKNKNAPYVSTHARIPEPMKPVVTMLANTYRSLAALVGIDKATEILEIPVARAIENAGSANTKNQEEAIAILKEALTYKANAGGKIKTAIKQAIQLLEEDR